jgi:hypothetical protein
MRLRPVVLALLLVPEPPVPTPAPTPIPEPVARSAPYVEKVEVRVRSVVVYATDAKGNTPSPPLRPADFRVLENGKPAEVIDVEPMPSSRPKPAAPNPAPAAEPAPPPDAPDAKSGTAQYVYLDTTALNLRSMKLVTDAIAGHLDGILALGPLEIILADATPRVYLPFTADPAAVRKALHDLGETIPGKQLLLNVRKDALKEIRDTQLNAKSAMASDTRAHIRSAAEHEIALLRISFDRLAAWAAARPDTGAGILYYANDGFDMDPIEVYRTSIGSQDPTLRNEVLQLESEYGGEVSKHLAELEGTLAGKGLVTVPVTLGATTAEFANSAGNMGLRGGAAMRQVVDSAPVFFYERPTEPMRLVADATGGEVISSSSRFGAVLDHLAGAYVVTFRVGATPDGRAHPLVVQAARPGLTVRTSKYLLTGSPRSLSIERAVRVLEGSEKPGDLPVLARLVVDAKNTGAKHGGMLRLAVSFAAAQAALGDLEGRTLPIRLTLAVDLGTGEPFTSSEDIDWKPESTSFRWQVPMTWPSDASRIAIVVEEVSTGLAGSAIVDVPPSS